MDYNPDQCRLCGAPIRHVTAPTGEMLSVGGDLFWLTPDEKGAHLAVRRDGTTIRGYRVEGVSPDAPASALAVHNIFRVGVAHWTVCPHVDGERRERASR